MNPALGKNCASRKSLRALEGANFFLADVQTGLGPFVAAYLAARGWTADHVGDALTLAGIVTVVLQTPAGAFVDRVRSKRAIVIAGSGVLAIGALLLFLSVAHWSVYTAQSIIGAANPFLGPTLAALTMGLVGPKLFDRQFGRNQSFNSAGNVACAAMIAMVSRFFGIRSIFLLAAALALPTTACVLAIQRREIDDDLARGGEDESRAIKRDAVRGLAKDRVLLTFLVCAFLFHLSNAAMLPQLGEFLARGSPKSAAGFMSACILVTQIIITVAAARIGRVANEKGRKPLLLLGFAVLPLRGLLYTVLHSSAPLIAVQLLDGVANAIWVVVSILVIADRTRGTGHFNLAQGTLATAVGLGAALSTLLGGQLIARYSYRVSFLTLGAIALVATAILLIFIPETRRLEGTPEFSGAGEYTEGTVPL